MTQKLASGCKRFSRNLSVLGALLIQFAIIPYGHARFVDCNNNGIDDVTDISNGDSTDCNQDGVPDDCESDIAFRSYDLKFTSNNVPRLGTPIDYDGDGDLDYVAGNFNGDLHVFENLDGTTLSRYAPILNFPFSIFAGTNTAAADIDGDGDHDLLGRAGPTGLGWIENVGPSVIEWPLHEILTPAPLLNLVDFSVADIEGDGDQDIFARSPVSDAEQVFLFRNNGSGVFGPAIPVTPASDWRDYALADVNGDGALDVVLGQIFAQPELVWVAYDPQTESFGTPQTIAVDVGSFGSVEAGDVDGDNEIDLIATSFFSNEILVFYNLDGLGTFSNPEAVEVPVGNPDFVRPLDLDGDDQLDLLIGVTDPATPTDGNFISWAINTGGANPTFGPFDSIDLGGRFIGDLVLGDMNGDGAVDIIVPSTGGQDITSVFLRCDRDCDDNGIPDLCEIDDGTTADCNGNGFPDICDASNGDCDGDGVPDDCETDCDDNRLPDVCEPQIDFVTDAIPGTPGTVVWGLATDDIDGDGDSDVMACDSFAGNVIWFTNDGDGTFGPASVVASELDLPTQLEMVDVDEDGWRDAVIGTQNDGRIIWCRNLPGSGRFGAPILIFDSPSLLGMMCARDINGDGAIDIAFTEPDEDSVSWIPNEVGETGFGSRLVVTDTLSSAFALDIGDLDADLDNDIVAVSSSSNAPVSVLVFNNQDGQGTFDQGVSINPSVQRGATVHIADINSDGSNDIFLGGAVASGFLNAQDIWFSNDASDGSVWSRYSFPPLIDGFDAQGVATADLDQNGKLDVIRTSRFGFRWWTRAGQPGEQWFNQQPRHFRNQSPEPRSILSVDLDLDGDLDILTGAFFDEAKVFISWNTTADCNADGLIDRCQLDSNGNGVIDECDLPLGDLNCDGVINLADLPAFVTALVDEAAYQQQYAPCERLRADMSNNLVVDGGDIAEFVLTLTE